MHRFSPCCPRPVDGNITSDCFLWTENWKAAILPEITITSFQCGTTSVWCLKRWTIFDRDSPVISVKTLVLGYLRLLPSACSSVVTPGAEGAWGWIGTHHLQRPGGEAWWNVSTKATQPCSATTALPHSRTGSTNLYNAHPVLYAT